MADAEENKEPQMDEAQQPATDVTEAESQQVEEGADEQNATKENEDATEEKVEQEVAEEESGQADEGEVKQEKSDIAQDNDNSEQIQEDKEHMDEEKDIKQEVEEVDEKKVDEDTNEVDDIKQEEKENEGKDDKADDGNETIQGEEHEVKPEVPQEAVESQEQAEGDPVEAVNEDQAAEEKQNKGDAAEGEGGEETTEEQSEQKQDEDGEKGPEEQADESPADDGATESTKPQTAEDQAVSEQEPLESRNAEGEPSDLSKPEAGTIVPPDAPSSEPTQDELMKQQMGMTEEKEKSYEMEAPIGTPENAAEKEGVPAPPHLPSLERSHTSISGQMSTSALNIVWSFGLNRNVPVLNLSDGVRDAIMYPCAHVGIMYDFKNNKQHTLQAHLNPITCSAVSQDKRWLVTGDVGPDAMVNIWDTYTGIPIQTMFDPNAAGGVVAVALTQDSRYLATMSALPVQTLAIWDWTVDGDVPICSATLKPEYGVQGYIFFDPTDHHHLVTNSENQVLFFHWEETSMNYFAPPLTDSDFNKPVGRYTQSIFQTGIARALTATSIGNLVVWDNNRPLSKLFVKPEVDVWTGHPIMDVNQSADKKALKIIKVQDKGINVLTTTDQYIVLGDTAGHVKFFDQGLRLIYWYQDFNTGPCTSISFAYVPDFEPVIKENSKYPSDATKQAKPFIVRNFIVGTAIAVYGNVTADGSVFKVIHREHDAAVHALASHPKLPIIAIGSYSGLLKLWNYKTKETVASRMFEKIHIQTVKFDPKGFLIMVGCTNGSVFIVDSVALLDQTHEPFRYARDAITHIAFSHNSSYFATADAGYTITVYKRQRKEGGSPYVWHGRYRSHYKTIRDLLFDVYLDSNQPKLLSLGEDRMLIEYELNNPGKNHVVPRSEDRIEQSAVPQCMCMYPPITKEHFLFSANDEYKLKCYNSTTKMCRKTVLGPTYGSPISKMMVVPTMKDESEDRFLAYITDDKVGLHILPASGNPHLAMALIAHPSGVSNIECSFDGAYLFTAGGPDYAVHMWEINLPALEAQAKLGGEDLIPFYGLLEGGRDGEMFAELEDLFYYAQLRHQGINSMERREIGNKVPIAEVPYIMRAMGFYPSEQEIEDMLNEIKYDDFVQSGQYQEDVDLGQFIKLYVNHRPAFGLAPEKLLWAFNTLADHPELGREGVIERGDLLDILQKKGEHITEMELAEHLTTLLGFNKEGGSCEQEMFDADKAGHFIAENLPYDINAEIMVNDILGFSLTQDPPMIQDEHKSFIKSNAGIL